MDPKLPDLPTRAEALLNQTDWVRKVVRGLGVDESSAEDVVQSTWVAALTTPPRAAEQGPGLRAWISRVARNFALRRIDRDARRALRERDSAREERLPSAADVVEREEARAQVVRALLEVHEPFRTTLLLRFYEGLEPRDIARVQNVPDSTVRNRLKRGLALLRERLEISQGPNWRQRCLLVLPALRAKPFWFPSPPKWIAASAASGGAVVVKAVGIVAAIALAGGGVYLAWDRVESAKVARANAERSSLAFDSAGSSFSGGASAAAANERGVSAPTQLVAATPHSTRAALGNESDAANAAAAEDDGHRFALHGRLLSPDGKPLKPEAPQVLSDARQVFLKTVLDRQIGVAMGGLAVNRVGTEGGGDPNAGALELEKRFVDLKGEAKSEPNVTLSLPTVVKTDAGAGGEQLVINSAQGLDGGSGAEISIGNPESLSDVTFAFAGGMDSFRPPHVLVASASGDAREVDIDAQGNFEFGDLRPDHWRLLATAPGYVSRRMEFDVGRQEKEKHLDVTLTPSPELRVKVVTPEGKDLFQAVIDDPELAGTFVPVPFAMREAPGPRIADLGDNPSQAFASGRWQRRENDEDKSLGDASGVLELTDALPLHVGVSVRGVVVDQRLVPAGSEEAVFVVPLERVKALVSGVRVRLVSARDGQPIAGASVEVEGLEAVTTDSQGEASVEGVPPGEHRITFEAQGVERRQEWIVVEPGAKDDLGVRQLSPAVKISGRVVDENGAPVQAVVHLRALDAQAPAHSLPTADEVESDQDGRFTFERAGRRRYVVSIDGGDRAVPVTTVDTSAGEVPELLLHASSCGELKLTFPIEPPPGSRYIVDTDDGIPVAVERADGWEPLTVRLGIGHYRVRIVSNGATLWTRRVVIETGRMIAFDESEARK